MRVETATEPVDRSASWVTSSARLVRKGGSATVVSLEGLRKALGERWPKLREAAGSKLEQLVQQHLGPSDSFVLLDDMNRLIIMPHAVPADAEIACLRIAYELNQAIAGVCRLDQLTVSPASAIGDKIIEVDAFGPEELAALAAKAGLVLTPVEPPADTVAPGEIAVVYQPVWDAEREIIRAYRCLPANGFYLRGLENAERTGALARACVAMLQRGGDALLQHLRREEPLILSIPVPYPVLSVPATRETFLATCRTLDARLRPYLAFAVKDFPPGIPQSRVAEVVTILQAFCSSVAARAPHPAARSLIDFRTTGIKALGLSLKGLSYAAAETEIASLVSETRRSGLPAFADHVDDAGMLRLCLERGVCWLMGEAIIPAAGEPGALRHMTLAEIYKTPAAA
jgi:hypothetical protein